MMQHDSVRGTCAVFWKERREQAGARQRKHSGWLNTLVLVALVGGLLPDQLKPVWTTSWIPIFVAMWVMFYRVANTIADSVAGERERHTLESLVSTPLPSQAIVWGKIMAAVVSAAPAMLLAMTVALGTSNGYTLIHPWHVYTVAVMVGIVLDGVLAGVLAAGAGMWISVKSRTTRHAQQTLSGLSLLLWFLPIGVNRGLHGSLTSPQHLQHLGWVVIGVSAGLSLIGGVAVFMAQRSLRHLSGC